MHPQAGRAGRLDYGCVLSSHACALSTGSCRHNCDQEDRCLPPSALEPGQTAAHDRGDNGQCQGAGPHWAHLLAVYKRRTGAEAQVILSLFGYSSFCWPPGHQSSVLGPVGLSKRFCPGNQISAPTQLMVLNRSWTCIAQAHFTESACRVNLQG